MSTFNFVPNQVIFRVLTDSDSYRRRNSHTVIPQSLRREFVINVCDIKRPLIPERSFVLKIMIQF